MRQMQTAQAGKRILVKSAYKDAGNSKGEEMNWLKEAVELCHDVDVAPIKRMLGLGSLIESMITAKEYKHIQDAGCWLAGELAEKGYTFPQKYMTQAHELATKFNPESRDRMITLAMPERVAKKACYWTQEQMDARLDIAKLRGWKKVVEKYCSCTRRPNTERRESDYITERRIKSCGDILHDEVQDILVCLLTSLGIEEFEKDLEQAYCRIGKKRIAA